MRTFTIDINGPEFFAWADAVLRQEAPMTTQKQLEARKKKLEAKKKKLEARKKTLGPMVKAAKKRADVAEKRERKLQKAFDKKITKFQRAHQASVGRTGDARRAQYKLEQNIDDLEGEISDLTDEISDVTNEVPEEPPAKRKQNHVEHAVEGDA